MIVLVPDELYGQVWRQHVRDASAQATRSSSGTAFSINHDEVEPPPEVDGGVIETETDLLGER